MMGMICNKISKIMGTRWEYDRKMMGKWWEDDRKIMGTWWELDGNYMGKCRKIWEYDGDMGQLWENDGEHMVNIRMVNIWEWSFQQLFSESHSLSCSWTCPTFSTTLSCFFVMIFHDEFKRRMTNDTFWCSKTTIWFAMISHHFGRWFSMMHFQWFSVIAHMLFCCDS